MSAPPIPGIYLFSSHFSFSLFSFTDAGTVLPTPACLSPQVHQHLLCAWMYLCLSMSLFIHQRAVVLHFLVFFPTNTCPLWFLNVVNHPWLSKPFFGGQWGGPSSGCHCSLVGRCWNQHSLNLCSLCWMFAQLLASRFCHPHQCSVEFGCLYLQSAWHETA